MRSPAIPCAAGAHGSGASCTWPRAWRKSTPARGDPSNGVQIFEQLLLLGVAQLVVAIARLRALAIVQTDRVVDGRGTPVMQVQRASPQSPQRSGAHFAHARGPLRDAVAERAHVMEQQVREQRNGFA